MTWHKEYAAVWIECDKCGKTVTVGRDEVQLHEWPHGAQDLLLARVSEWAIAPGRHFCEDH